MGGEFHQTAIYDAKGAYVSTYREDPYSQYGYTTALADAQHAWIEEQIKELGVTLPPSAATSPTTATSPTPPTPSTPESEASAAYTSGPVGITLGLVITCLLQ